MWCCLTGGHHCQCFAAFRRPARSLSLAALSKSDDRCLHNYTALSGKRTANAIIRLTALPGNLEGWKDWKAAAQDLERENIWARFHQRAEARQAHPHNLTAYSISSGLVCRLGGLLESTFGP